MINLRSFRLPCLAVSLVLTFIANRAQAQVQTAKYVSMGSNTNGYYEYLPQGYGTNTNQTYPLIVFIHGVGELGDGSPTQLTKLLNTGLAASINVGELPVSINVNGTSYSFIVISPQFINWPTPADIEGVLNYATSHYRVNTSRIYLTGLSMGGGVVWDYTGASSANANRIAAIVPIAGASWPDHTRARTIAGGNVAVWALHNNYDPTVPVSYTNDYVSQINESPAPNPMAKKTIFDSYSHDAWTNTYNSTNRDETGKTIYEWMLQFAKGTTPPPPTPTSFAIPGKVEAESFSSMNGIQLESTSDAGGGQDVGWQDNGDYMNYNVNVGSSGTYTVNFRVATMFGGAQFQLKKADGTTLANMTVPNTGGFQNWQTISAPVNLSAGTQTLQIYTSNAAGGWNLNWMDFAASTSSNQLPTVNAGPAQTITLPTSSANLSGSGSDPDGTIASYKWSEVYGPSNANFSTTTSAATTVSGLVAGSYTFRLTVTDNSGATATSDVIVTVNTSTSTSTSSSIRIEAENYSAMNGIKTESTSDVGGGLNVGWQDDNDWMDYSVNMAAAGTYTVNFRVASMFTGAQFQVRNSSGTVLTTVTVPNTGTFQTWQTVSAQVTLPAGQQTLRLYTSKANGGWNINWWEIQGSTSVSPSSIHIEAETYSTMNGVQTENTSDVGGGLNVGWQDTGDWMDYSVNVSAAGSYTVNFRVSSMFTGAQFQLRNSSGTVLATLTVPNTGSFQTWQTINTQVSLPAGQQTLRIYTSQANGGWNINWWEINSGTAGAASTGTAEISATPAEGVDVYPNPVQDRFVLRVANELTGTMKVRLLNTAGAVQKQFSLSKTNSGPVQTYLSLSGMAPGEYVLTVNMGNWTKSIKLIKQ